MEVAVERTEIATRPLHTVANECPERHSLPEKLDAKCDVSSITHRFM